jgi:hypothetical protein
MAVVLPVLREILAEGEIIGRLGTPPLVMKTKCFVLAAAALAIWAGATAPAAAGLCDTPPYGADPKKYQLFIDTFSEGLTVDFFSNICRAKYLSDEKMRKSLVDIGVPSQDIDHDDVTLIAIKVMEQYRKLNGVH